MLSHPIIDLLHNKTVYLCGQVAEDKFSNIATQTRTMLAAVDELLIQAAIAEPEYLVEISVIAAQCEVGVTAS